MKIGMILEAPFPPDIRVEKEAQTLAQADHDVFVMATRRGNDRQEEEYEKYQVYRFDLKKHHFLKNISRDYRQLCFIDPVWKRGINSFVKKYGIDVLHVHDLPLVKTAFLVSKKYEIPLIADFHENFPAQVQALRRPRLSLRHRLYHSYGRWSKYEEQMSHKVDAIIVVVQEYKDHLMHEHGILGDKITVVHNTPDPGIMIQVARRRASSGGFTISYIGSYGPHRGLDVVIRAMPEIVARIPNAKFVVVGKGRNRPELERLARELNVSDSVEFVGWKDYSEIIPYFQNADVGIIPHHASEHTDSTVPNKLFEYMYFKVPVIVSDRPPLQRIVEETKAGIVFRTNDTSNFAQKMLEIRRNSKRYGKSGYRAVMDEYNWQVDGGELVRLYRNLEIRMASKS